MKCIMRSLAVVPHEPVHELLVELAWIEKQPGMVINELFLDCAVEPLIVGIHLRHFWVCTPMRETETLEFLGEMLFELWKWGQPPLA